MHQSHSTFRRAIYRSTSPKTWIHEVSKSIYCTSTFSRKANETHQIHRPNNRHRIRQKMAPTDLIKASQMRKTWRPDLTSIRSLAAVTDDKDAHFSFWRFDGAISLSGGHGVAFCEEQEMVDQSFHVFLHCCPRRRGDFVVLDSDGAGWHLVEALVDDAEGLAEFFHAAEITVIAVPVYPNWDVKLDLVVRIVRLTFAYIPGYTAASKHDAGERVVESVSSGDNTNALSSAFPYSIICEQFLCFVDSISKLSRPLVDVVKEAKGEVLVDAARTDVGRMKAGTGDTFVELLPYY